jgi:hypothetical protein
LFFISKALPKRKGEGEGGRERQKKKNTWRAGKRELNYMSASWTSLFRKPKISRIR